MFTVFSPLYLEMHDCCLEMGEARGGGTYFAVIAPALVSLVSYVLVHVL